jgi:hypothetical protein
MISLVVVSSFITFKIKIDSVKSIFHLYFFLAFLSSVYCGRLLFLTCINLRLSFKDYKYYINFKTTASVAFNIILNKKLYIYTKLKHTYYLIREDT